MKDTPNKDNGQLSKGLKNRHVQLIALGGTIGTGLFLGAGESIQFAGPSIVLAYLIAGVAGFFIMRSLGELLLSDVNCHSYIEFIDKYLGKKIGFVAGWTYWACWISIAMAEITAAGLYVHFWFPGIPQWVTGLFLLIVLFLANSINVSAFGETEFWFALIKVVAILALIATGVVLVIMNYKTPVGHASLSNLFGNSMFSHGFSGFLLSFQMVIFSFAGIEMIGMTASETNDPEKVIPKAINEVPSRILIFYIGSLIALMCIYPWNHINAASSPFVQVFQNIGVGSAAAIINFVVLTAAVSACNSAIFTTGRMIYSLTYGSKKPLGKQLGSLNKHQIPSKGILFSIVIITLSLILNAYMPDGVFQLVSSIATTCFLFIWGLIVLAHLKYRKVVSSKNETNKLTFKMPFFPYSNYFVLGFLVFVAIVMLFRMNTLFALVGSIVWIIALYIIKSLTDEVHQKR
ncbi:amino acid permease [Apilactobacillus timberlakei]|uniref:amino acid permease n=1 Tax=Apilactobacillus timberlakei TaxID=2008380 RepID=UPI001126E5D1|nr:amino acid permease [Apilactobacillus timberlakei]TPR18566.1 amino acid permease [Apilactobacillus timberlakei]TPR20413.1 amino acid permease [Apilactobacillus timberlakei]TPR22176.1 amino acid permease [Apilactobacillus timberlakei]